MFISVAKRSKSATGSEPAESTKIKGVVIELSLKDFERLKTGGSTNCWPRFSITKFYTARVILSSLIDFSAIIL